MRQGEQLGQVEELKTRKIRVTSEWVAPKNLTAVPNNSIRETEVFHPDRGLHRSSAARPVTHPSPDA